MTPKILMVSLGCDKNLVDSEFMLGQICDRGYEITDCEEEADVVVVNTCCFIHDAKEESIETILTMAQLKETGRCKALIVTGCLAERYKDEMSRELPEVDCLLGTTSYDKVLDAIDAALEGNNYRHFDSIDYLPSASGPRISTTGGYYEYLKIAEGCDKRCTYCVIPSIRGVYRSVPMEDLLLQAKNLASIGTKELILIAQETTRYGIDLYGRKALPELLRQLAQIDGIEWLRILYCYPEEMDDALIDTIATEPKICHYLDLPIQHASDTILKKMGRKTDSNQLNTLIAKLRKRIPDICLRTTLITGFPTETKEDFEQMKRFMSEQRFERLGVFTYSLEEGTPAASFEPQISDETKQLQYKELMELQQQIAFEKNEQMIGQRFRVMVEGRIPEDNVYVGRTYMDAPGIDGCVFFEANENYESGEFVTVTITEAKGYDLIGECYYL